MSKIKKMPLSVDLPKRTWYVRPKEQHKKRVSESLLCWGANHVPFSIKEGHTQQLPSITYKTNAMIKADKQHNLVGPLIGILTSQTSKGSLMGLKNNFKDIIKAGQKYGAIVFVFTPQDVNWNDENIQGKLYHFARKKWKTLTFPFPNVIYNRIPTRRYERKELYQTCISKFLSYPNLFLFNPNFFNKKEVFSQLSNHDHLNQYLPDTKQFESKEEFLNMLELHSSIYLKPASGKKGSGIIKVEFDPDKKLYKYYCFKGKKVKTFQMTSEESLWKTLKKRAKSSYIMQQAVSLARTNQCPFDARVLVQKNKRGIWKVSGVGIRVAGHPGSITTHVPRGGKIASPESILSKVFSKTKTQDILDNINQLALSIASALEQEHTHLGEVSMDIGIDRNEQLWFFEANAKPMKFDEPGIRSKQLKRIIDYAKHLTFGEKSPAISKFKAP